MSSKNENRLLRRQERQGPPRNGTDSRRNVWVVCNYPSGEIVRVICSGQHGIYLLNVHHISPEWMVNQRSRTHQPTFHHRSARGAGMKQTNPANAVTRHHIDTHSTFPHPAKNVHYLIIPHPLASERRFNGRFCRISAHKCRGVANYRKFNISHLKMHIVKNKYIVQISTKSRTQQLVIC